MKRPSFGLRQLVFTAADCHMRNLFYENYQINSLEIPSLDCLVEIHY